MSKHAGGDGIAEKQAPVGRAHATRVLVIDDEPMIGRAVWRALRADCEVDVLQSAETALELLELGVVFDVILCDLNMPRMTGQEFHRRLSLTVPSMARRVVFLSGSTGSAEGIQFLARVSNRYIDKPFDVDVLRGVVRLASASEGARAA